LTGLWKADKFSYEFPITMRNSNTQKLKDSISLLLRFDSTFVFKNAIKVVQDTVIQTNFIGRWKVSKRIEKRHQNQFEIRFYPKDGFGGMPSRIPLYKKNHQYELFIFIGDPDAGERIGLKKDIPENL